MRINVENTDQFSISKTIKSWPFCLLIKIGILRAPFISSKKDTTWSTDVTLSLSTCKMMSPFRKPALRPEPASKLSIITAPEVIPNLFCCSSVSAFTRIPIFFTKPKSIAQNKFSPVNRFQGVRQWKYELFLTFLYEQFQPELCHQPLWLPREVASQMTVQLSHR